MIELLCRRAVPDLGAAHGWRGVRSANGQAEDRCAQGPLHQGEQYSPARRPCEVDRWQLYILELLHRKNFFFSHFDCSLSDIVELQLPPTTVAIYRCSCVGDETYPNHKFQFAIKREPKKSRKGFFLRNQTYSDLFLTCPNLILRLG